MRGYAAALYREAFSQGDRMFLWAAVAMGLGVAVYFALPREPAGWMGLASVAITALLWRTQWRHRHAGGRGAFARGYGAAALFLMTCGFAAAIFSAQVNGTPVLAKDKKFAQIVGTIASIERLSGSTSGSRVVLQDVTIENMDKAATPRKVRLSVRKDSGLRAGQQISVLAHIRPISPQVAPGAYDFQRHLFFEGIGAAGFAYRAPDILAEGRGHLVSRFFEDLRARIDTAVRTNAGAVTSGIMTALITGQRGAIAEEDNEAMRDSGLYHLLSISGSHVSMVVAILFFTSRGVMALFPWFALRYPAKKIAAVVALMGAVFYCALAGADVPALRAAMMSGLVLIAIMLDRFPFSLRLIAVAAMFVLLTAPHALVGVSFQMSFAAVAAMICFFEYIAPVWMRFYARAGFVRKTLLYVVGLILTSIIAGGVTGLFTLYHFQQFQIYGVISNMLAVPLTGIVIMPAAIAALILMPFGWEGAAFAVMEWGTVWMLAIAHWAAGLDGAVVHVAQWPKVTFGFLCAGLVLFLAWQGWAGKGFAAFIMLCGIVIAAFHAQPDILVSERGKLIAVRGDDGGLYFSTRRAERFSASNWQRLSGHEGAVLRVFEDEGFPGRCDAHGCRMEMRGAKVAVSFGQLAWREDCGWADLVIAQVPMRRGCGARQAYDFFDFYRNGAHAFYIGRGGSVRVKTVADERGERLWTGR